MNDTNRKKNRCRFIYTAIISLFSVFIISSPHASIVSVTASSHDGHIPANTIDGSLDPEYRWSAKGNGEWIKYDLGSSYKVDDLEIAFFKGDQRDSHIDIELSTNNSSWSTVWSGTSSTRTLDFQKFEISDTNARWVRITGYGNTSNSWNSITEVQINTLGGTTPPSTDLNGRYYLRNMETDNYLRPQSSGLWSKLETTNKTTNARTGWELIQNDDDYYIEQITTGYKMRPQTSVDFDRLHMVPNNYTGNWTQWAFFPQSNGIYRLKNRQTGKYIRPVNGSDDEIMQVSTTDGNWTQWRLIDLEVTPPPPGPGGDLPSDVLSLTNWKITIPFDSSGNDGSTQKATEIDQPELDDYELPGYFEVNDSGDGVVFTAHTGGATTNGSGYPRSELREMTSDGSDEISWSSGSGKHTLFIEQSVNHLPVVKKHIVVGQIHDGGDDVIVFRLEGSKLFIDINGDDGPTLTNNYQLGTTFTAQFVVEDNETKVYYNGSLKYTHEQSFSNAYFKAGAYTQSACGGPKKVDGESCSAYGEVEIFNVWTRHE